MPNLIYTQTNIANRVYSSRPFFMHNHKTDTCIELQEGILLALGPVDYSDSILGLYFSLNNGYNWILGRRIGITDLPLPAIDGFHSGNADGICAHIVAHERSGFKRIKVFLSQWNNSLEKGSVIALTYIYTYDGETFSLQRLTSPPEEVDNPDADFMDSNVFTTDSNEAFNFITFVSDSTIYFLNMSIDNTGGPKWGIWETSFDQDNYFDLIATCVDDNNIMDVLSIRDFGTTYELTYLSIDQRNGDLTDPVTISSFTPRTLADLNIGRDGYGNLIAYWSQFNDTGTSVEEYFSLSIDNGLNWTDPIKIPETFGQSDFFDNTVSQIAARTNLLECDKGFLLGYVRTLDSKANAYLRVLSSEDGINYNLGEELTAASHPTKDVVGLKFFKKGNNSKATLDNAGTIRISYQIGQGNNRFGRDSEYVIISQKLLSDEAFQELDYYEYDIDEPLSNQLLCNFNLLGSTTENIDYFAEGLTGLLTERYSSAFEKFGTSIRLIKYDPIQNADINGANAFVADFEIFVKAFIDDISYGTPLPSGQDNFNAYMERDTRQVFLPPQMFLERTNIINDGNFHKRTTWIMVYMGNRYELTQIVPKFMDNQIVYYTVNAYLLGPNRDPFTRFIQPTET